MPNLENEIAATYAELFLRKHGYSLGEEFGENASYSNAAAMKAVETFRSLIGLGDEDCSRDERILFHLKHRLSRFQ